MAARRTPDALAALIGPASELARLQGREAAFGDRDDVPAFAKPDFTCLEFRRPIDFLLQQPGNLWEKRLVPSAPIEEAGGLVQEGRHAVVIDEPSPLEDLVAAKPDPVRPDVEELLIDRRYVRIDPDLVIYAVMQIGRRWWEPVTLFVPDRGGKPNLAALNARRGGKLLWKRK